MSEDKIYPSMVIRIQAEAIKLLEQENKQLKEVIEEVREELSEIDDDILKTCKRYDVNGIKVLQILDKAKTK